MMIDDRYSVRVEGRLEKPLDRWLWLVEGPTS
jgi:hypothetical protein